MQRFCNSKCRKKYSYHKNKKTTETSETTPKVDLVQKFEELQNKKIQIDKVSMAGVGNAAAGTLLVEGAKAIFNAVKSDKNKPATKGDFQELKDLINTRYFLAHNVNPDPFGRKAYFDIRNGKILYLDENSNSFHIPQFNL